MTRIIKFIIITITLLVITTIVLTFWHPLAKAFYFTFGSFYMIFLPGYIFSFIFYKEKEITIWERIMLSFGLTIIIVPLIIYLLYLGGMELNLQNSSLVTLVLILISIFIIIIQAKIKKSHVRS